MSLSHDQRLYEIYDEANMHETDGKLDWGEIGLKSLLNFAEISDETYGGGLMECDVESVQGAFERWYAKRSREEELKANAAQERKEG